MTDERFIYNEDGVPRPHPDLPEHPPEEEPEQFRGEPFARRVVAYLLGQMSEEESEQFEDECFAQKHWPSQIGVVEEDLIDAYLHDELGPEQHRLFELNYLTTRARQERVKVAAALLFQVWERAPARGRAAAAHEEATWAERLRAFFGGRAWGPRAAVAVALVVIAAVGFWLYLSRTRPPRVVATLSLTSSVANRSEGGPVPAIKLPPDAEALRVVLQLPNRATTAPRYRAELDDEDGGTTSLDVEKHEPGSVSVLIPASRLARGQYALTLLAVKDDGTEQPFHGTYVFAIE